MRKTVVLNVVGLTASLVGEETPNLRAFRDAGRLATIKSAMPAVTCSAQTDYLTGCPPREHGVVGNGWYYRDVQEVKLWQQAGGLVQRPRIWDEGRRRDAAFTCANLFWWFAMYGGSDVTVTPRPMYPADGRKVPDVWTHPGGLRDALQAELGTFPLFKFWGPAASIECSDWIARAAVRVDEQSDPTLTLVYLPHLDYVLQKQGPSHRTASDVSGAATGTSAPTSRSGASGVSANRDRNDDLGTPERKLRIGASEPETGASAPASRTNALAHELHAIDEVVGRLIEHYRSRGARVVVLSEYGIENVDKPVHLNRVLRDAGYLSIRRELGTERLDAGASRAFAVADHQIAHVYVRDGGDLAAVKALLEQTDGVGRVLGEDGKREVGLDHERSGELVVLAKRGCWFTYYFWLDDALAPDYARTVDIHRKPGYDPAELFLARGAKPRLIAKLLARKAGFRNLLDVTPLDATLVKGSHGLAASSPEVGPLLMTNAPDLLPSDTLASTDVRDVLLNHVFAA